MHILLKIDLLIIKLHNEQENQMFLENLEHVNMKKGNSPNEAIGDGTNSSTSQGGSKKAL